MRHSVDLARAIARQHGLPSEPISSLERRGSVNHVFVTGRAPTGHVIRFARDPQGPDDFAAEQWCARAAAAHGIRTPPVIAVGRLDGIPYGVQPLVAGEPGDRPTRPGGDQTAAWSTLGRYGCVVNGIQPDDSAPDGLFTRFGRHLATAWSRHLDHNLASLDADDPLLALGALTPAQQAGVRAVIADLSDVPLRFGLSHADLAPRNLIVERGRPSSLIDWGSASFGPVPWTDLVQLGEESRAGHGPTVGERAAFVEAITTETDRAVSESVLPAMALLHRVDLVRWAVDRRPDRVDQLVAELRRWLA